MSLGHFHSVTEAAVDFPPSCYFEGSLWSLARPCSGAFRAPVFSLSHAAEQPLQKLLLIFPVEWGQ
jgi:hypothetical protein